MLPCVLRTCFLHLPEHFPQCVWLTDIFRHVVFSRTLLPHWLALSVSGCVSCVSVTLCDVSTYLVSKKEPVPVHRYAVLGVKSRVVTPKAYPRGNLAWTQSSDVGQLMSLHIISVLISTYTAVSFSFSCCTGQGTNDVQTVSNVENQVFTWDVL